MLWVTLRHELPMLGGYGESMFVAQVRGGRWWGQEEGVGRRGAGSGRGHGFGVWDGIDDQGRDREGEEEERRQ